MTRKQTRALAGRLKALRDQLGVSQAGAAALIDVTPQQWSHWETGRRAMPLDPFGLALAERAKVTLDWLYRGVEP